MQIEKIISIFLIVILFSCNKRGVECSYVKYEGKAVIISIAVAPANESNCPLNPRKVLFAFIPNDTTVRNNYIFKNWSDTAALTINGGTNPSQLFLDSLDITVGKEFMCNRQEITQGTCTPVYFQFTGINLNDANGCK